MLKPYAVENLRVGMKVGRDVTDLDCGMLIASGTVLDQSQIDILQERSVFVVYIKEEEKLADIPGRESLLDEGYVGTYQMAYSRIRKLLNSAYATGKLDEDLLIDLEDTVMKNMSDGAMAVSQIHNMERVGEYIYHHSLHVAILAALMGEWLDWKPRERRELVGGALLHDLGKLKVEAEILNKKGSLTPEEYDIVKQHPDLGMDMLDWDGMRDRRHQGIRDCILQHHERCDGSGYPYGCRRENISPYGRVMAVLDIYDAMASDRVFVNRHSPFDIFKVMFEDMSLGKLDPEYTVAFMRQVCRDMIGNWVLLSNGVKGRIVYIAESRVTSLPLIQTVMNEFIDLNVRTDLHIESILTAKEAGAE